MWSGETWSDRKWSDMIIKTYDSTFQHFVFYHFFITRHLFSTEEKRKFVCTLEQGVTERVCRRSHSGSP